MNIGQIGQFAFDSFQKIKNNRLAEKDVAGDKGSKVPEKDKFEKNNNIENYSVDIDQLTRYAKSIPDVREDKLAEIAKRISEGYYSQDQFMDALSEKFAALV